MRLTEIKSAEFLTIEDVPVNGPTLRVGGMVVAVERRTVQRVGYRLCLSDAPPMPPEAMDGLRQIAKAAGWPQDAGLLSSRVNMPYKASNKANDLWRYLWLRRQRMGGPDRGVHVWGGLPMAGHYGFRGSEVKRTGERLCVVSKRMARVGTYYPPSGSGEWHEDGGLCPSRTVVLVTVKDEDDDERWEMMAGDLAQC